MTLNKHEVSGIEYVMEHVFNPVISECQSEIELILNKDTELNLEIEEKVERIMKNRALKKALNADLIVEEEQSREYSGELMLIDTKTILIDKLKKEFEANFTYVNLEQDNDFSDSHLHVYNIDLIRPQISPFYATIDIQKEAIGSGDLGGIDSDLALAI